GDIYAYFLASFADGALLNCFQIFQLAADNAPAARFGRPLAKREEGATAAVKDKHTDANPWNGYFSDETVALRHGWRWKGTCRPPKISLGRGALTGRL